MKNLKPGDVFVFKAGDDWVGKSIAWLTESDVSHAAILLENGKMVEMGSSGIHVGGIEVLEGNSAIVLRLSPEQDSTPVMAAAQKYIDCETRYDFPALVILAGLIVYRRIRPTQRFVAISDVILRAACVALDGLIQRIVLNNPDKALVCSQLAYQVYEDCGKEYHIQIENGLLQAAAAPSASDDTVRLVELAGNAAPDLVMAAVDTFPQDEELAKELYLALVEQDSANGLDFAAADLGTLPAWCGHFLERLEEFLKKSQSNLPINALFITPADLAYKAKNLERVGEVNLKRLRNKPLRETD